MTEFAERFGNTIPIIRSPILQIVMRDTEIGLDGVSGLIFTSENGVRAFRTLVADRRFAAYCVGSRTAQAARNLGLRAREVGSDASSLVNYLTANPPGGKLVHLRGANARGDVARRLTAAGQRCAQQVLYDQTPQKLSQNALEVLAGTTPVLLPIFSPRSAMLLSEVAQSTRAPLAIATMSEAVTNAWTGPKPTWLKQASVPTSEAMLDALGWLIDALQCLEGNHRPS
ncbi:uroporphyrinogen-III synthase [Actibacterium lipolyticum]|uniref:Uroporphyrinogen-III synthase n=1 Tax=Actibacterium lipolyticum TaxID=1524263 RepID=A0A238KWW5_9RHOB|nr:uroporphyrinogen-III synthase [Actibacterium lipolyticum]SMX47217.1 uroporphyrinogen-III synthase [Actibacterium lipolyticum]